MNRFLINVVETYRVPTVAEAERMHEEFKNDGRFELVSFAYTHKYDKKNDEEYEVVKVKKVFNEEKVLQNLHQIESVKEEFQTNF